MSKPEIPQKPRSVPPPPVPKRIPRPQPPETSDYPMNATWLFHPAVGGGGDEPEILLGLKAGSKTDWMRANPTELPPKMNIKSTTHKIPTSVQSSKSPPPSGSGPGSIIRDANFANEIKNRCIQRLLEKLPPQVHYVSIRIVFAIHVIADRDGIMLKGQIDNIPI